MNRKILIVEDDASQRLMISLLVQKHLDFGVVEADGARMALSILRDSDLGMVSALLLLILICLT